MTASAMPGSGRKIDIVSSIENTYETTYRNLHTAARLAWLPYLLVLAAEAIAVAIGGGGFLSAVLSGLVHAFGVLVFGTVFLVRWHRFILLGEADTGGMFTPAWRGFFFTALRLTISVFVLWLVLVLLAALPPHMLTVLFPILGGIALGVVAVRVSLVFPAAAVERPLTFRAAWDLIDGNTWRYFVCAGLCYLPFAAIAAVLGIFAAGTGWLIWLIFEAVRLAISFAGVAVVTTLASHVYRDIAGGPGATAEAA